MPTTVAEAEPAALANSTVAMVDLLLDEIKQQSIVTQSWAINALLDIRNLNTDQE